jgi:transposase-like protein
MTRRRYSADFIREAVALVQGGRSVGEVAELERENEFLGKASAFFASKAHRKP